MSRPPLLRVVVDASPLVNPLTGVGVFTLRLIEQLARRDDVELAVTAISIRGRDRVRSLVPDEVAVSTVRLPARPVRELWRLVDRPRVDRWVGAHDVMHASFGVPPSRGTPVSTVHDLTPLRFPELRNRFTATWIDLVRRALRRGGWIHTVSDHVRGEVIDHLGADPDRVVTVPNGVDEVQAGDVGAGVRAAGGARYVLAVGTVEPRKGLPSLVEAFDRVATTDDDVRLVVAGGDGWGVDRFDAAVASARHRDRIVRLGYVDARQRADLLAGASVLAYPSLYEGFGLPPLEAMSAGTPVVTSDAGALPEVVGDAALITAAGDVEALADALQRVLTDGELAARLVEAGHRQVARYSWQRCASGLTDLFRRAAAH